MQKTFGADGVITTEEWKKRCMQKMKTLTGDRYYKQVNKNWDRVRKERDNLTEEDWRKSIGDCGLTVEWYEAIKEYIEGPCEDRQEMQTQQCGLDRNVTTDCPPSLHIPMVDGQSEPIQTMGGEKSRKSEVDKQSFAQQFNSLNSAQRLTLLHLPLSSVQNRKEAMIYEDVIALQRNGLVMWVSDDDEELIESTDICIDFERLLEHKRFFEKVMERNPLYNAFQYLFNVPMVTFDASRAPLGTTVLCLSNCKELEVVDLSGFKNLHVLYICDCPKLHKVIGCADSFNQLRWLEIHRCPSYDGYSSFRIFPYLQEFHYWPYNRSNYQHGVGGGELDVSGCVYLRTLNIVGDASHSSIRGLEGLHSLIELNLGGWKALQNLPNLGHMKHLTHLTVRLTAVEEIKGIEQLWSLEKLYCSNSKLKTLGDLTHLPHLKVVDVWECPVTKDPSSPFFGKWSVRFNHKIEDMDVSDVSDSEHDVSCEGS